jgi:anti-anti-sigma regulatory factor
MSPPSVVPLPGKLTVATVEETHAKLREALAGDSAVTLDCSQASEIDVTFLQLLVSAQRSAARAGKTVRLTAPPSGALAEAMQRCGFPSAGATSALAEILPPPSEPRP